MTTKGISYSEAVRYLYEKYLPGENINNIYEEETPREKAKREKRQELVDCMKKVQKYLRGEYESRSGNAIHCRNYAEIRPDNPNGRWSKELCDSEGLGYTQPSGHSLVDWANENRISKPTLAELGMLGMRTDSSGLTGYYDLFKDRLMKPLRDDFGILVAYTGRRLDGKSEVRHYNNETTALFQK